MAFRHVLITQIAAVSSLPDQTSDSNRVTNAHYEEVGVSADGLASALPPPLRSRRVPQLRWIECSFSIYAA
jgi:hypothetical protein